MASVVSDFVIPYTAGRITDAKCYDSKKVVIHIQDLHCHPEVQRNIAKIISLLDEKYGLPKVYLEGAIGNVDTSWLTSIQDRDLKSEIIESLISQGRLTGAEYYSVKSDRPNFISGIENESIYKQNLVRLDKILSEKDKIDGVFETMSNDLGRVRDSYYSSKHKKFEKLVNGYKSGEIDSRKFYDAVRKYTSQTGINLADYKNITTFLSMLDVQDNLKYKKISKEMQEYVAALKQKLPFNVYKIIAEKMSDYSKLDEAYVYLSRLQDVHAGLDLAAFPNLGQFFEYVKLSQRINPLDLVREEESIERDIYLSLAANEREKDIVFISSFLNRLKDFYENKITAEDYNYYEKNIKRFQLLWTKYFDGSPLDVLARDSALLEDFYKTNLSRNDYFMDNCLGKSESAKNTDVFTSRYPDQAQAIVNGLDKSNITVIITGGFHTTGIEKLLEERKVSYLVITPNVTQDTKFSDQVYSRVARAQARVLTQTIAMMILSQEPGNEQALEVLKDCLKTIVDEQGLKPETFAKEMSKLFAQKDFQKLAREHNLAKSFGMTAEQLDAFLRDFQAGKVSYKDGIYSFKNLQFTYTKENGLEIVSGKDNGNGSGAGGTSSKTGDKKAAAEVKTTKNIAPTAIPANSTNDIAAPLSKTGSIIQNFRGLCISVFAAGMSFLGSAAAFAQQVTGNVLQNVSMTPSQVMAFIRDNSGITNINYIVPGQIITLPTGTYTVKAGDTLGDIIYNYRAGDLVYQRLQPAVQSAVATHAAGAPVTLLGHLQAQANYILNGNFQSIDWVCVAAVLGVTILAAALGVSIYNNHKRVNAFKAQNTKSAISAVKEPLKTVFKGNAKTEKGTTLKELNDKTARALKNKETQVLKLALDEIRLDLKNKGIDENLIAEVLAKIGHLRAGPYEQFSMTEQNGKVYVDESLFNYPSRLFSTIQQALSDITFKIHLNNVLKEYKLSDGASDPDKELEYFTSLYDQYLDKKNGKAKSGSAMKIDKEDFRPSAMLTAKEREDLIGAKEYSELLEENKTEDYSGLSAKSVELLLSPLNGGLGTNVSRQTFLAKLSGDRAFEEGNVNLSKFIKEYKKGDNKDIDEALTSRGVAADKLDTAPTAKIIEALNEYVGIGKASTADIIAKKIALADKYKIMKIGAKGSDICFDIEIDGKPVTMSVSEAKLLKTLNESKGYARSVLEEITMHDAEDSVNSLFDRENLYSRLGLKTKPYGNLTYRQIFEQGKKLGIHPLHIVSLFPGVDPKTNELIGEIPASGSHGQVGAMLLRKLVDIERQKELADIPNGHYLINPIYNEDGNNNTVDPVITGWMAKNKVPMVMISTTKTGIDRKGGQIGVQKIKDKDGKEMDKVAMLELATAKNNGQADLFSEMGLSPKVGVTDVDGKLAPQYFNTNTVLLNYSVLIPFFKDLIAVMDEAEFNKLITPDLIDNIKNTEVNGKKTDYAQLEGALGLVILNLANYFKTNKDPKIQAVLDNHNITNLLRIVNVNETNRVKFFTPVKMVSDIWLQFYSGLFEMDTNTWELKLKNSRPLPGIEMPANSSYFKDVLTFLDAFDGVKIPELDSLEIKGLDAQADPKGKTGNFKLANAVLKGQVTLINKTEATIDLNDPSIRAKLRLPAAGPLVLENVTITVDEGGVSISYPKLEKTAMAAVKEAVNNGGTSIKTVDINADLSGKVEVDLTKKFYSPAHALGVTPVNPAGLVNVVAEKVAEVVAGTSAAEAKQVVSTGNKAVTVRALADTGVKIEFGTSGWRGLVSAYPERIRKRLSVLGIKESKATFVIENIRRAVQGVAEYHNAEVKHGTILVVYDPRKNNKMNAIETAAILAGNGIKARIIVEEPTPTPVSAYLAGSDEEITGVINFTASHNPATDDGLKYSPYHGGAAPKEATDAISKYANEAKTYRHMSYNAAKANGMVTELSADEAVNKYVNGYLIPGLKKLGAWDDIVNYVKNNPKFMFAVDPMQGTSVKYMKALFEAISKESGRECYTMIHTDNHDPSFSQVNGAPNPTLESSTKELMGMISKDPNLFPIAVDGDADRFGPESADTLIALFTYFLNKEIGLKGKVGKTVATSNFVNAVAEYCGLEVVETAVGFKWMVDNVVRNKVNFLVAGEESAHVGVGPFMQSWDDGMVINMMKTWIKARTGMSVAEYQKMVEEKIGKKFIKTTETKRGADDSIKKDVNELIALTRKELSEGKDIQDTTVVKKTAEVIPNKVVNLITSDGVKVVFENGDWMLLRPSGTEPAIKLYTEVTDEARKEELKRVALVVAGVEPEKKPGVMAAIAVMLKPGEEKKVAPDEESEAPQLGTPTPIAAKTSAAGSLDLTMLRQTYKDMGFTDIGTINDSDLLYFNSLYKQYLEGKSLNLVIDKNFAPSARLSKADREKYLGAVEYNDLKKKEKEYREAAHSIKLILNPLNGGLGTSLKREEFLKSIWDELIASGLKKQGSKPSLSAKGSDMFFDVTISGKTTKISVSEVKILKALREKGSYTSTTIKQLGSSESVESINELLDTENLYGRMGIPSKDYGKMTYRQIFAADKDHLKLEDTAVVGVFPGIDATDSKKLWNKIKASGSHGQYGQKALKESLDFDVSDTGHDLIGAIYNEDGINNGVDPIIAGWMAKERVPIVMLSTTKASIDKKGGQIGVELGEDGKPTTKKAMLELAMAKGNKQEALFGEMGLTEGESGAQYFNTNTVVLNYSVLVPFLRDLKKEIGDEEYFKIIGPLLIKNAKSKEIEVDGVKKTVNYMQVEGALGTTMINLSNYVAQSDNAKIKELLKQYNIENLLRIVNLDTKDRTRFFTPSKLTIDYWLLLYSDLFKLDTNDWELKTTNPGHLPGFDFGPKCNGYYDETTNVFAAFNGVSVKKLDYLEINGRVNFANAVLKGSVSIDSDLPGILDLNDAAVRDQLGLPASGPIVLEDVKIKIRANGEISVSKPLLEAVSIIAAKEAARNGIGKSYVQMADKIAAWTTSVLGRFTPRQVINKAALLQANGIPVTRATLGYNPATLIARKQIIEEFRKQAGDARPVSVNDLIHFNSRFGNLFVYNRRAGAEQQNATLPAPQSEQMTIQNPAGTILTTGDSYETGHEEWADFLANDPKLCRKYVREIISDLSSLNSSELYNKFYSVMQEGYPNRFAYMYIYNALKAGKNPANTCVEHCLADPSMNNPYNAVFADLYSELYVAPDEEQNVLNDFARIYARQGQKGLAESKEFNDFIDSHRWKPEQNVARSVTGELLVPAVEKLAALKTVKLLSTLAAGLSLFLLSGIVTTVVFGYANNIFSLVVAVSGAIVYFAWMHLIGTDIFLGKYMRTLHWEANLKAQIGQAMTTGKGGVSAQPVNTIDEIGAMLDSVAHMVGSEKVARAINSWLEKNKRPIAANKIQESLQNDDTEYFQNEVAKYLAAYRSGKGEEQNKAKIGLVAFLNSIDPNKEPANPVEGQGAALKGLSQLNNEDEKLLIKLIEDEIENDTDNVSEFMVSVLLAFNLKSDDNVPGKWMEKRLENLKGRKIWLVSPEISVIAGGLGYVVQTRGRSYDKLTRVLQKYGTEVGFVEPMYKYKLVRKNDVFDGDGVRAEEINWNEVVKDKKVIQSFTKKIGSREVKINIISATRKDDGISTLLIEEDCPAKDAYFSKTIYNYDKQILDNNGAEQFRNSASWEDFSAFFGAGVSEGLNRAEQLRMQAFEKRGLTFNPAVVWGNDSQSVSGLAGLRDYSLKKDSPLYGSMINFLCHTIDNTQGLTPYPDSVEAIGVDKKYHPYAKQTGGNYDVAALGGAIADLFGGVAWTHVTYMRGRYGNSTMSAFSNGDDIKKALARFEGIYNDLGFAAKKPFDVKTVTGDEMIAVKKEAISRANDIFKFKGTDKELDPNKGTLISVGRLVKVKVGDYVFNPENIMELVKNGKQVVICSRLQLYKESRDLKQQYMELESNIRKMIDSEKDPVKKKQYGKFIFLPQFVDDEKQMALAGASLLGFDSRVTKEDGKTKRTGANEYWEADGAAYGTLITAIDFYDTITGRYTGEGAIKSQGIEVNEQKGVGNTLLSKEVSTKGVLEKELQGLNMWEKNPQEYAKHALRSMWLARCGNSDISTLMEAVAANDYIGSAKEENDAQDTSIKAFINELETEENPSAVIKGVRITGYTGKNGQMESFGFDAVGKADAPGLEPFLTKKMESDSKDGTSTIHYLKEGHFLHYFEGLLKGVKGASNITDYIESLQDSKDFNWVKKNDMLNSFLSKLETALKERAESIPSDKDVKLTKKVSNNSVIMQSNPFVGIGAMLLTLLGLQAAGVIPAIAGLSAIIPVLLGIAAVGVVIYAAVNLLKNHNTIRAMIILLVISLMSSCLPQPVQQFLHVTPTALYAQDTSNVEATKIFKDNVNVTGTMVTGEPQYWCKTDELATAIERSDNAAVFAKVIGLVEQGSYYKQGAKENVIKIIQGISNIKLLESLEMYTESAPYKAAIDDRIVELRSSAATVEATKIFKDNVNVTGTMVTGEPQYWCKTDELATAIERSDNAAVFAKVIGLVEQGSYYKQGAKENVIEIIQGISNIKLLESLEMYAESAPYKAAIDERISALKTNEKAGALTTESALEFFIPARLTLTNTYAFYVWLKENGLLSEYRKLNPAKGAKEDMLKSLARQHEIDRKFISLIANNEEEYTRLNLAAGLLSSKEQDDASANVAPKFENIDDSGFLSSHLMEYAASNGINMLTQQVVHEYHFSAGFVKHVAEMAAHIAERGDNNVAADRRSASLLRHAVSILTSGHSSLMNIASLHKPVSTFYSEIDNLLRSGIAVDQVRDIAAVSAHKLINQIAIINPKTNAEQPDWARLTLGIVQNMTLRHMEKMLDSKDKAKTFDYYVKILKNKDPFYGGKAVELLGKLGDKRAIDILIKDTNFFNLKNSVLISLGVTDDQLLSFYAAGLNNREDSAIGYFVKLGAKSADLREQIIKILTQNTEYFDLKKDGLVTLGATNDQLFAFYETGLKNGESSAIGYFVGLGDKRAIEILTSKKNMLVKELNEIPTTVEEEIVTGENYPYAGDYTYSTVTSPNPEYYNEYNKLNNEIQQVSDAIAKLEGKNSVQPRTADGKFGEVPGKSPEDARVVIEKMGLNNFTRTEYKAAYDKLAKEDKTLGFDENISESTVTRDLSSLADEGYLSIDKSGSVYKYSRMLGGLPGNVLSTTFSPDKKSAVIVTHIPLKSGHDRWIMYYKRAGVEGDFVHMMSSDEQLPNPVWSTDGKQVAVVAKKDGLNTVQGFIWKTDHVGYNYFDPSESVVLGITGDVTTQSIVWNDEKHGFVVKYDQGFSAQKKEKLISVPGVLTTVNSRKFSIKTFIMIAFLTVLSFSAVKPAFSMNIPADVMQTKNMFIQWGANGFTSFRPSPGYENQLGNQSLYNGFTSDSLEDKTMRGPIVNGVEIYDWSADVSALLRAFPKDQKVIDTAVNYFNFIGAQPTAYYIKGDTAKPFDVSEKGDPATDPLNKIVRDNGGFPFMIEAPWNTVDHFKGQSGINNNQWNVKAGETAWLLGFYADLYTVLKYNEDNKTGITSNVTSQQVVEKANKLLNVLLTLQIKDGSNADGLFRMGPKGQWSAAGIDSYFNSISIENNESTYAAIKKIYAITGDKRCSQSMLGIEGALRKNKDALVKNGLIVQGLNKNTSTGQWEVTPADASDVQSWGGLAFGPKLLDSVFGKEVTYNLVINAINMFGVKDNAGNVIGMSFSGESKAQGIISGEWTYGYTVLLPGLANYYPQHADQLNGYASTFRKTLKDKLEFKDGSYAYSTANSAKMMTSSNWGWRVMPNKWVSAASSGWSIFDYLIQAFGNIGNPFITIDVKSLQEMSVGIESNLAPAERTTVMNEAATVGKQQVAAAHEVDLTQQGMRGEAQGNGWHAIWYDLKKPITVKKGDTFAVKSNCKEFYIATADDVNNQNPGLSLPIVNGIATYTGDAPVTAVRVSCEFRGEPNASISSITVNKPAVNTPQAVAKGVDLTQHGMRGEAQGDGWHAIWYDLNKPITVKKGDTFAVKSNCKEFYIATADNVSAGSPGHRLSIVNGIATYNGDVPVTAVRVSCEFRGESNASISSIVYKSGNVGNISAGLSETEEAQMRTDIARSSDELRNQNADVINIAKERSVKILEREQDLRSALKAKGVADNEIETTINALRNSETSFQWFTSKVFGKEKYFLGSESALAVDVINFLLEQEKATGIRNLVNEYILHEALERTKLAHNEIIGLTQTFFNRPSAQTNGDTLLGQSLRRFISTSKSSEAAKKIIETPVMKEVLSARKGYFTLDDYQKVYEAVYGWFGFDKPSDKTKSESTFRSDLNGLVEQGYLTVDKSHKEDRYSVAGGTVKSSAGAQSVGSAMPGAIDYLRNSEPGNNPADARTVIEKSGYIQNLLNVQGHFTLADYGEGYNEVAGTHKFTPLTSFWQESAKNTLEQLVSQGYLAVDATGSIYSIKPAQALWNSIETGLVNGIKNTDIRKYVSGWSLRNIITRYESLSQENKLEKYTVSGANVPLVKSSMGFVDFTGANGSIILRGQTGEQLCNVDVTLKNGETEETVKVSVSYATLATGINTAPTAVFNIDFEGAQRVSQDKEVAVEYGVRKALKQLYSAPDEFYASSQNKTYIEAGAIERVRNEMKAGSNSALMIDTDKIENFDDIFSQIDLMGDMGYDTLDVVSAMKMPAEKLSKVVEYARSKNIRPVFEYKPQAGVSLRSAQDEIERKVRSFGFSGVVVDLSGYTSIESGFVKGLKNAVSRSAGTDYDSFVAVVLPKNMSDNAVTKECVENRVKLMYTHVVCKDQAIKGLGENSCVKVVETDDQDALTVEFRDVDTAKAGEEIEAIYKQSQAEFVFIELPLLYKGIKGGYVSFVSKSEELVSKIAGLINERTAFAKLTPEQQYRRGYKTGVKFAGEYMDKVIWLKDQMAKSLVKNEKGDMDPARITKLVADFANIAGFDVIGEINNAKAQQAFVRSVLESVCIGDYINKGNLEYQNKEYTRLVGYFMAEDAINGTDKYTSRIFSQKKVVYNLIVNDKVRLDIANGLNPMVDSMLNGTLKIDSTASYEDTMKFLDLADRLIPEFDTKKMGNIVIPNLTEAIQGAA
jgi:phosphoglucomutase